MRLFGGRGRISFFFLFVFVALLLHQMATEGQSGDDLLPSPPGELKRAESHQAYHYNNLQWVSGTAVNM